jgi:hypothetical protein
MVILLEDGSRGRVLKEGRRQYTHKRALLAAFDRYVSSWCGEQVELKLFRARMRAGRFRVWALEG